VALALRLLALRARLLRLLDQVELLVADGPERGEREERGRRERGEREERAGSGSGGGVKGGEARG
jgi:hypothetical protein